jgi:hypothetical protein
MHILLKTVMLSNSLSQLATDRSSAEGQMNQSEEVIRK